VTKVTVVGAGAVGTATAFALLAKEVAREVVLYDIDETKVQAEVLDLAHGTPFTGSSEISGGADISVTSASDLIFITAGAKQKPGQTRMDLAGVNIKIMESLLPDLLRLSPNAIFVLVTNPCDVLATAALKITGLPSNRLFSSGTVLDSSRLRWLLAKRLDVAPSSVHALIVGEHGDSEIALWSQTRIGPVPILEWVSPEGKKFTITELEAIAEEVKNAAYKVIAGKGATNFAIGLVAARIAQAVLEDENVILPISSLVSNYLGVSGIALSVPTILNRNGAHRVIEMSMSSSELEKFHASAQAIKNSLNELGF
jgi:L-lactate dehydrogenase